MPNIHPVGSGDWVRWMMHSFPGWGKTSLLATAADLGKVLIVRSSLDLMPARAVKTPGLDEVVCDTWEQMLEVQDFARMSDHDYLFIAWDSVSLAQDALLDDIWAGTIAEKPARAFKQDGTPLLTPASGLDRGEYGRNMERIQQWVRHMTRCNRFHFIIVGHSYEAQNQIDDAGGVFLQPWVQGKNMISKICGYTNLISFLEVKQSEKHGTWRRLHFAADTRWYAKDQFDAFPKGFIDQPTVPKIMAAIEEARGKPLGTAGGSVVPKSSSRGRGRAQSATKASRRGVRREQ